MAKFKVDIVRIGYSNKTIEVEAETQEQADAKALNEAGNHEFSETSADYALEGSSSREQVLLGLLREIHNEIGQRCDEDNEGNPFDLAGGSTMADLDNSDIMLRIRKEIHP